MKKILIITVCLFLAAFEANAKDYTAYCSANSASKTFSGSAFSLSGVNLLTRNIAQGQIERALKKETNSKFKVDIDTFWGVNMFSGEFKSLRAKSSSFNYDGMYFSDLDVETVCPFNKVSYKDDKLTFEENMVLKYSANITQDDLNKAVNSSKYKKLLDKMNSDKIISSLVKIQNSNIQIEKDKLIFKYDVTPLPKYDLLSITKGFIKPLTLAFGADLKVDDGKLAICNFNLNSMNTNYGYFLPLINMLNPMSWKVDVDKNNKGTMEVESVKIENSKVALKGYVIIPKKAQ